MKYIYVLAFIMIHTLFGLELGYTATSPLYTHFTYMFQHSGVMHLVINSIAFVGMFRTMERFMNGMLLSVAIMAIAFVTSFFSVYNIPTVGASGMVYAMFGLYFGMTWFSKCIKITDTKKYLLFLFCVIVSLAVSFFKENSNAVLHFSSMVLGTVCAIPVSLYDNKKRLP